jgi:AraC-like DNA-binding protein
MTQQLHGASYFAHTGMPLAVSRVLLTHPHPQHSHDFSELVVVLGGRGHHVTGDQAYPIAAGDVFVVQGEVAHAYRECAELQVVNVLFLLSHLHLPMQALTEVPAFHVLFALEPALRRTAGGSHHHLTLTPEELGPLTGLLQQLGEELDARHPGYRGMALGIFLQILIILARQYAGMDHPEPRRLLQLGTTLTFIDEHLADPITLAQLAEIAGLSASTLWRAFRRILGLPPIEYVLDRRFARAAELLRATDLPITILAARVGIADSNLFARQFRRRFGCSPREYRR